jgi:hypothetical protein
MQATMHVHVPKPQPVMNTTKQQDQPPDPSGDNLFAPEACGWLACSYTPSHHIFLMHVAVAWPVTKTTKQAGSTT